MKETNILIVGASVSGLSSAACLQKQGLDYIMIEKTTSVCHSLAQSLYRDYEEIIDVDSSRFEDLKQPVGKQKYFGKDGLYFCGFWIAPTGQIREISLDARKIAEDGQFDPKPRRKVSRFVWLLVYEYTGFDCWYQRNCYLGPEF